MFQNKNYCVFLITWTDYLSR